MGSADDQCGRVLAGRYALEHVLGRGGMGLVYRAHDRLLDRRVAIKVVLDDESQERFLDEAKRTAQIRHPAIVEVFDFGKDGNEFFLVMELLDGEALDARLTRDNRLSPSEAVAIGAEICDALGAAHAVGVVHRDIKPANVLLLAPQSQGGAPAIKVVDFGIAKRVNGATAHTNPNMLVGTIAYMAPEQITGTDVDGRADLYALGVLLFRAIAGRNPFPGDNAASMIHGHLSVPPPRLRSQPGCEAIPARLEDAVRRLLEKDPGARPKDAASAKALLLARDDEASPMRSSPRDEIELDISATDAVFELDAPPKAIAPAPPLASMTAPRVEPWSSPPRALARPEPTSPLASIPEALSKRLAAYGAFAVFLNVVFFGARIVPLVGFGLLSLVGLAAFIARRRHR